MRSIQGIAELLPNTLPAHLLGVVPLQFPSPHQFWTFRISKSEQGVSTSCDETLNPSSNAEILFSRAFFERTLPSINELVSSLFWRNLTFAD